MSESAILSDGKQLMNLCQELDDTVDPKYLSVQSSSRTSAIVCAELEILTTRAPFTAANL